MAAKSSNLMALLTMAPSAFAGGEVSPLPRIKSLSALKAEVQKHFGKLSSGDVEALAAWLNQNFFRLKG